MQFPGGRVWYPLVHEGCFAKVLGLYGIVLAPIDYTLQEVIHLSSLYGIPIVSLGAEATGVLLVKGDPGQLHACLWEATL